MKTTRTLYEINDSLEVIQDDLKYYKKRVNDVTKVLEKTLKEKESVQKKEKGKEKGKVNR
jgi:hypothetical protein